MGFAACLVAGDAVGIKKGRLVIDQGNAVFEFLHADERLFAVMLERIGDDIAGLLYLNDKLGKRNTTD